MRNRALTSMFAGVIAEACAGILISPYLPGCIFAWIAGAAGGWAYATACGLWLAEKNQADILWGQLCTTRADLCELRDQLAEDSA